MQFIKDGPDIPNRLIQAHQDGQVVFFCGAGISIPSGLPGFEKLVDNLYEYLGHQLTSSLEIKSKKNKEYDRVIGYLENNIIGGRNIVRKQIAEILNLKNCKKKYFKTHESILTLSINQNDQCRLITTNFDRIFEYVISQKKLQCYINQAPYLPIPKKRWNSLVYLHGLLPEKNNDNALNNLVVSSGDFGLAYLTERWAARFVSELFRNYIVCFIGYSLNDPVMRYVIDAIAADKSLGEYSPETFAFVGYNKENKYNINKEEWEMQGITPILYTYKSNHSKLHKTLHEWASTYKNGILAKENIVAQYAIINPLDSQIRGNYIEKMIWALSDPSGLPAKLFAHFEPIPPLDWLKVFSNTIYKDNNLLDVNFKNLNQFNYNTQNFINRPLSKNKFCCSFIYNDAQPKLYWDLVFQYIAEWLTRHLNNPELIIWVENNGGVLHPKFEEMIRNRISNVKSISNTMKTLWNLVLAGRLKKNFVFKEFYSWVEEFKKEGLTLSLHYQLKKWLTPHFSIGIYNFEPKFIDYIEPKDNDYISSKIIFKIKFNCDSIHHELKELKNNEKWQKCLPCLLRDATNLLKESFDLMYALDKVNSKSDDSHNWQPYIKNSPKNKYNDFDEWTILLELTRDAWLKTFEISPKIAKYEVENWDKIKYPIFRRLVFFALESSKLFTPNQALTWLLQDNNWWIWAQETKNEVYLLMNVLVPKLNINQSKKLLNAILKGPPTNKYSEILGDEGLDRLKYNLLINCKSFRIILTKEINIKIKELSNKYPKWKQNTKTEWEQSKEDLKNYFSNLTKDKVPNKLNKLMVWLRKNPQPEIFKPDNWWDLCLKKVELTSNALIMLSKQNVWLVNRWNVAFEAWSYEKNTYADWPKTVSEIANVIIKAKDSDFDKISFRLSRWLLKVSNTLNKKHEEILFKVLFKILKINNKEIEDKGNDPITNANYHPIGIASEIAFVCLFKTEPKDGEKLTGNINSFFTELCTNKSIEYRYGITILSSKLISLYKIDPEWTKENLLPFMKWNNSIEDARVFWSGFLWSPSVNINLIEEIKFSFLETAERYKELGILKHQYILFLIQLYSNYRNLFKKNELRKTVGNLPEVGLINILDVFRRNIENFDEKNRKLYWNTTVWHFIETVWPKDKKKNTQNIITHFARLCISGNELFPEIYLKLKKISLLNKLSDISGLIIPIKLHKLKLDEKFPNESLDFLYTIVDFSINTSPSDLDKCLNKIEAIDPNLKEDNQFKKLREHDRKYN